VGIDQEGAGVEVGALTPCPRRQDYPMVAVIVQLVVDDLEFQWHGKSIMVMVMVVGRVKLASFLGDEAHGLVRKGCSLIALQLEGGQRIFLIWNTSKPSSLYCHTQLEYGMEDNINTLVCT